MATTVVATTLARVRVDLHEAVALMFVKRTERELAGCGLWRKVRAGESGSGRRHCIASLDVFLLRWKKKRAIFFFCALCAL